MKINEITNAQDQLALLRTIMDNTWSAIRQQADAQTRQQATQTVRPKPKLSKLPKAPKRAPMAPSPKPLPKTKPAPLTPQQIKAQQQKSQQDFANQVQKTIAKKQASTLPNSLKPLPTNVISPINHNRTDKEMDQLIKMARGEKPFKPL
jgi:hypothetical protein